MYYLGRGCEEDDEKAFSYFSTAAEGGVEASNYYLGLCYYFGYGCDRDYLEAYECFDLSKEIYSHALFYLGECARNGTGRKRSYEDAFEYYIQAADAKHSNAQMAIGRAFYTGEGVQENDIEAVKWLELAVANDNSYADYLLGECYFKGIGVVENEAKGIALLRKAAEAGEAEARDMLYEFGYDLKEATISEQLDEGKNVVGIHRDPASRANALYTKTVENLRNSGQDYSNANVVQLSIIGAERIEALMSSNEEEN